jgi:lipopolysaccharide transport system ATP-binding protein
MLVDYPGFGEVLIPDVAAHELRTGGSHDYELPDDMVLRFENMLVVTKMHVHGSPHNVQVLQDGGVRHVVIYRDLRDVAVSHYFYVRQTPWHPEYPIYSNLTLERGLTIFAERTLVAFADWVRSWHENRDAAMSLELTYERMLENPVGVMTRVAEHFDLDSSPEVVEPIVAANSFQSLSGGRRPGQDNGKSFFRKGVAGDWKNHFTPELKKLYKRSIGDFLMEFGYERDKAW